MSHTPGPWKRYRDKNGRVSKIEGKGYRVCTFQPSDPNTNNDSALIEAAPDMLRALEEVVAITENLPVCPFCGAVKEVQKHSPDCLSHEIDQTIREAKGEA